MRLDSKLLAVVLAGASAAVIPACAPTSGYVVASYESPPPPARAEYVRQRAGYVWVAGRWIRDYDGDWRWQSGYYVRERPGQVYVPGHWHRRGRSYVWVEGRWRRGTVVYRRR